jgi:hypothetical protein
MPGSVRDKATRYNDGKVEAVYAWIRGDYAPNAAKRAAIERAGGPEAARWEEPASDVQLPNGPPPVVVPGSATPAAVAAEADAILAEVQRGREFVSNLQGGDPGERISHLERLSKMLVGVSKMRGVLMSERQILESPHWRSVEAAIVRALEPWPDGMRAVAEALDGLRGEA